MISPLPDFRLNPVHHLLKYGREQSHADKSSAGSNHTSINKHHTVCYLNPIIVTRRLDAKMKKKRGNAVNSTSASVLPVKSKSKVHNQQQISPILPVHQAYSLQVNKKKKELFDTLDQIPEAKAIRAWNLARSLKEKEFKFVLDKLTSKPVSPSMFFNPLSSNEDVTVSQRTINNVPRRRRRVVNNP